MVQSVWFEWSKRQVQRVRREGREAIPTMEGADPAVQRIDRDGVDAASRSSSQRPGAITTGLGQSL